MDEMDGKNESNEMNETTASNETTHRPLQGSLPPSLPIPPGTPRGRSGWGGGRDGSLGAAPSPSGLPGAGPNATNPLSETHETN